MGLFRIPAALREYQIRLTCFVYYWHMLRSVDFTKNGREFVNFATVNHVPAITALFQRNELQMAGLDTVFSNTLRWQLF